MIYEVRHRTSYAYAEEAAFSQHLLRLTPRGSEEQRVLDSRITISPPPDGMTAQPDIFGNLAHVATVSRPHATLEITAVSRIERQAPSEFIFEAGAPWEQVREAVLGGGWAGGRWTGGGVAGGGVTAARVTRGGSAAGGGAGAGRGPVLEAASHAFPSAMTEPDAAIEAYAAESLTPGRPLLAAAKELMHRIWTDFEYLPGATAADTLPAASFAGRRGVCQDFAHVMLACLRSRRLPARYVSGYLRTLPPEGRPRLEGADASHAWVAVWDPVLGWVDFDPTNDVVPGLDHITLAWGRDYLDVSPVSGTVVGAGAQTLRVGVDVVPLHAEAE